MKTLKFKEHLSKLILNNHKTTTWRLFDDKNLSTGDIVSFVTSETSQEFAKAELIGVTETTFATLTKEEMTGHEQYSSDEEMYQTFSKYYNREVDKNSPVKIIKFKLVP